MPDVRFGSKADIVNNDRAYRCGELFRKESTVVSPREVICICLLSGANRIAPRKRPPKNTATNAKPKVLPCPGRSALIPHSCLSKSSWSRWFIFPNLLAIAGTGQPSRFRFRAPQLGLSFERSGDELAHRKSFQCCQRPQFHLHRASADQTAVSASSIQWASTPNLSMCVTTNRVNW